MSPELVIRPAAAADSATILSLIQALGDYAKLSHQIVATLETLRETLFGDRPQAEALIAEWNGEPAGFALFFHNYSTFLARRGLYLEDLFVKPELRGHGIGKALFTRLAQLAVERGCGRLEWSVLDWNEPAIGFYTALGAEPQSESTVFRLSEEALRKLGAR